jgi:hypothetical protein
VVTVVVGADVVVIGVGVFVDGDTVTVVTDALGEGDTIGRHAPRSQRRIEVLPLGRDSLYRNIRLI